MRTFLVILFGLIFSGCQKNESEISAVPRFIFDPITLDDVLEKADFIGIVNITEIPKGKFWESNPPIIQASPLAVFKGDSNIQKFKIIWQTKPAPGEPREEEMIKMPKPGQHMAYLRKTRTGLFERFDEDFSFHLMPEAPNVMDPDITVPTFPSLPHSWRGIIEVSPFITRVGDPVFSRHYSTRLADEPYEGLTASFYPGDQFVVDFTRKKKLIPKDPGLGISIKEPRKGPPFPKGHTVKKGQTVINEIELTKYFDLSKPGEYWFFQYKIPLRFEVTDKILILRPPLEK